ncbi:MAG: CRISPR system precrRNA processing endoribonuclease RAMP protein Cas6 [Sphaerochaeta sp.]
MKYIPIQYKIRFNEPVPWGGIPEIIFRSVLGMQLHRLCCVLKDQEKCSLCPLRSTCVYAWFFETYIPKDIPILEGRDRAPHPFLIEYEQTGKCEAILQISFLGTSRNFIPYITESLERAGKSGVARARIPFEILEITFNNYAYKYDMQALDAISYHWPRDFHHAKCSHIKLSTPCRIKSGGIYLSKVSLQDLLVSIHRRVAILETLFGEKNIPPLPDHIPMSLIQNQFWKDQNYYSVRQKDSMKMGGVVGSIKLLGETDALTMQLLEAGEAFHVGKNVSFGLGKIILLEE